MLKLFCDKCDFEGTTNLEETGPHTKATCRKCGSYIKMLNKEELENSVPTKTKLLIETDASIEYMPLIMDKVAISLTKGFVAGDGFVSKPFDEKPYSYDFYYED